MKELLKKLNKVLGEKMFMLFLFTFIFLITTVLGNIGDSGYSGIQVENYFSGSGKQGINQNISFNDSENNSHYFLFEDGLLINYTIIEPPLPPGPSILSEDLKQGLIAYYKLDQTSGVIAYDSTGMNNGTANNERVLSGATGIINTAADFEQGNDFINPSTLNSSSGRYTFNFWAKPLYINNAPQFVFDTFYGRLVVAIVGDGTNSNIGISTGTIWKNFGVQATPGELKMYTFTLDGYTGTGELYINGVFQASVSGLDKRNISSGQNTKIGGEILGDSAYDYDGILDEFGIWERVLNSTEISEIYNSGSGSTYSA